MEGDGKWGGDVGGVRARWFYGGGISGAGRVEYMMHRRFQETNPRQQ